MQIVPAESKAVGSAASPDQHSGSVQLSQGRVEQSPGRGTSLSRDEAGATRPDKGLLGTIMNTLPYGVALVNASKKIIYANSALIHICAMRLAIGTILGKNAQTLLLELGSSASGQDIMPPCEIQSGDGCVILCRAYPIEHLAAGHAAEIWVFDETKQVPLGVQ